MYSDRDTYDFKESSPLSPWSDAATYLSTLVLLIPRGVGYTGHISNQLSKRKAPDRSCMTDQASLTGYFTKTFSTLPHLLHVSKV